MPDITITFDQDINSSLDINDSIYYVNLATSGGFDVADSEIVRIGKVVSKTNSTITVGVPDAVTAPRSSDFIFFSKDNIANLTSLIGYYAEIKFINNSTEPAELFSMGVGAVESSK